MTGEISPQRITELARKWRDHTISEAEKAEFDEWFNAHDDSVLATESAEAVEDQKERLYASILSREAIPVAGLTGRVFRLWPRVAVAASAAAVIAGSSYLFFHHRPQEAPPVQHQVADIAPGGNKAVLTLADGQQITLTDARQGKIAAQQNTAIEKTAEGSIVYTGGQTDARAGGQTGGKMGVYNSISTPRGGWYQVTLADGTKVMLNAASSLRYPTVFSGKERKVELNGEAWFDVATDKSHPFIVSAGGQDVKVLGTEFNINSYQNEPVIKTTLLAGSVVVSDTSTHIARSLKPGQQAVNTHHDLSVGEVNTEEAIAWKNGYFMFESEGIASIMRKIARWYDVEVVFTGAMPTDKFDGTMKRFVNVSQVLKKLSLTNKVHFKIDGRTIMVSQ